MNEHIVAQCPNRDIECEYYYAGCDVKKPQGQLESHGREAMSVHLSLVSNLVQGSLSQKDHEIQELKEELSRQRRQIQELKQQHTDLQGRTNRHWILLSTLMVLLSGTMVYAYLYQTDLLVDLNINTKEALSSRVESLSFQFKNSCMNISNLYGKIQELNSSIQQIKVKQDSKIDNVQQEFSSLLEEREANKKMREQILNEIWSLSIDVEKNVMDLKNLESAYNISTKKTAKSFKNFKKQLVTANDEWRQEFQHLKSEIYCLGQQVNFEIPVLPVYLNMTGVQEHSSSKSHWLSKPFYTHEGGYKMRLVVYPNGKYSGAGTHISVAIYLMSGKFDDKLDWPANVMLTVTLFSQETENKGPVRTFNFCSLPFFSPQVLDRVWNDKMAKIGVIDLHFASHDSIFLSDYNSLYFRVDGVTCEAEDKPSLFDSFIGHKRPVEPHACYRESQFTTYCGYDRTIYTSTIIYCGIHSCSQPLHPLSDSLSLDSIVV